MVKFIVLNSSRLDVAVAKELQISRNQALNLIKDSLVSVNLKPVSKPSFLLNENDEICVNFAPKKEVQNE
ncbi:MAG: RluA family pseudouridine synthase, partial [Campylobacter concisus]|nr:RluA family pseudouridine synthase [Campylobacter concisus]